ncbi:MAG: hypothetical protein ACXVM0_09810 [Flavisolibacter sp.]
MKKTMIVLLSLMVTVLACSKNSGTDNTITPDCSTAKSYATDVSPLVQTYCATNSGCHGAGSGQGPGPLTSYSQVFNNRSSIRNAVASGMMPQGSSLSAAQKNAIICWIDSGAQHN